jgi:hypothetical protein
MDLEHQCRAIREEQDSISPSIPILGLAPVLLIALEMNISKRRRCCWVVSAKKDLQRSTTIRKLLLGRPAGIYHVAASESCMD